MRQYYNNDNEKRHNKNNDDNNNIENTCCIIIIYTHIHTRTPTHYNMSICNDSSDDIAVYQERYMDVILCKLVEYKTSENEDEEDNWINEELTPNDIFSDMYIYYNVETCTYHFSGKIDGFQAYSFQTKHVKSLISFIQSTIIYRCKIEIYTEKVHGSNEERLNTYEYLTSVTSNEKIPISTWYNYTLGKKSIKKILSFIKHFHMDR